MSSIAALPPNLRQKMTLLARRIRLLAALHGGSLLLTVLIISASGSIVLDYCLGLSAAVRLAVLVGWTCLGGTLAVRAVGIPLCRKLHADTLAALVEQRHPELGERLTTAVELAGKPQGYHGSAALITLLIEEAEACAVHLDFRETAPARPALRLAGATAALLLLVACCAALWPHDSIQLGRRFLLPWRTPGALAGYSLDVRPGNITAARGRPLTFSVTVVPNDDKSILPSSSTLVIDDGDGKSWRRPMLAERPDVFSLVVDEVAGDFRYHIEAGEAVTDTYQVTAIDPVELAADSPTITIIPPGYAKDSVENQIVHGMADLTALQHSRIRLDFEFARPATRATLEWPSAKAQDDHAPSGPQTVHELVMTADRCKASYELPALVSGKYRLLLEEDHGIRTELEPRLLTVQMDQPPAFVKVAIGDKFQMDGQNAKPTKEHKGSPADDTKLALPGDSVPLEIALADDVGVVRADVEYRINDGPSQWQPIALDGAGSREAGGQVLFRLTDKGLEEGDTVRYRLRAADNRNVPEAGLKPHTIYYPAEQSWLTLKISSQTHPLRQQEILSQRDDIDRRLEEIESKLTQEQGSLSQLRPTAERPAVANEDDAKELKQVREQNRAVQDALRELASIVQDIRPLRTLAAQARDMAQEEMTRSDEALQRAEQATQPEPRARQLGDSDKELTAARGRIEQLRRANEQLAQARLQLLQLEMLSERQQQLAERTAANGTNASTKPDSAPQLKREQKDIADNLQRLAQQSEPLRKALEAARAEQAQQLAARARELAQAERELLEDVRETRQREKESRLAELADKQQALAERTSQLAQETRSAADVARTPPLRADDAKRAAQALREDNIGEALRLQHRNSDELERLAKEFEQASERAREPAEAVHQLARLQESLRQKLKEQEAKKLPAAAKQLDAVRREQEELARAAENVPTPSRDDAAQKQQREGIERALQARDALEDHDTRHAEVRMAQAAEALEQLAEQLQKTTPPQKDKESSGAPPATARGQAPEPASVPRGLPSREEAKQARELAQQQRDLTGAVQDVASQETQAAHDPAENPVGNLVRDQMELARQAAELAGNLGQQRGEQEAAAQQARKAAKSAEQTSKHLQAAAIKHAYQAGTQTAQELQTLTRQLSQAARTDSLASQQAGQLGERQQDLNRRMMELAGNAEAQHSQQHARQQDLQEQASDLGKLMKQLAQDMAGSPVANLSAQRAADSSRRAQAAMQQAAASEQQGNQRQAQHAQQQAAEALNQAATQVEMAAQQLAAALDLPQNDPATAEQPGQSLTRAQTEMKQAQTQLGRGDQQNARAAMERASQALQRAARQLQRSGQPKPNDQSFPAGGRPDPTLLGSDAKEHAGKRWGELPGELRTRVIQDMQAKYGEDYARIIQLYFEQIADTQKTKRP